MRYYNLAGFNFFIVFINLYADNIIMAAKIKRQIFVIHSRLMQKLKIKEIIYCFWKFYVFKMTDFIILYIRKEKNRKVVKRTA